MGELSAGVPSAAYDGAATVQVGWSTYRPDESFALAAARRPARRAFAAAPDLAVSEGALGGPVLARAPDGAIVAACTVAGADEGSRVFAARLGASGRPVGSVGLSGAEADASEPALAVGAATTTTTPTSATPLKDLTRVPAEGASHGWRQARSEGLKRAGPVGPTLRQAAFVLGGPQRWRTPLQYSCALA